MLYLFNIKKAVIFNTFSIVAFAFVTFATPQAQANHGGPSSGHPAGSHAGQHSGSRPGSRHESSTNEEDEDNDLIEGLEAHAAAHPEPAPQHEHQLTPAEIAAMTEAMNTADYDEEERNGEEPITAGAAAEGSFLSTHSEHEDSFIHVATESLTPPENALLQCTQASNPHACHFNPRFSSEYSTVIRFNDYSYTEAKLQSEEDSQHIAHTEHRAKKIAFLKQREAKQRAAFTHLGYTELHTGMGATGSKNQDRDAAYVVGVNRTKEMIIVAFHGSRNGSKLPPLAFFSSYFKEGPGNGDWGSNYNSFLSTFKDLGLPQPDGNLVRQVHRGFGNNFASYYNGTPLYPGAPRIQEILTSAIQGMHHPVVLFTGHSKGAAVATPALLLMKSYFLNHHIPAMVWGVLFSSPRALNKSSQSWGHSLVGAINTIRINVLLDPVTISPPKGSGFASFGTLALELPEVVMKRGVDKYGPSFSETYAPITEKVIRATRYVVTTGVSVLSTGMSYAKSWWSGTSTPSAAALPDASEEYITYINANTWTMYHLGSAARNDTPREGENELVEGRPGHEFDPALVPQDVEQILRGLVRGFEHLSQKGENPLSKEMIQFEQRLH